MPKYKKNNNKFNTEATQVNNNVCVTQNNNGVISVSNTQTNNEKTKQKTKKEIYNIKNISQEKLKGRFFRRSSVCKYFPKLKKQQDRFKNLLIEHCMNKKGVVDYLTNIQTKSEQTISKSGTVYNKIINRNTRVVSCKLKSYEFRHHGAISGNIPVTRTENIVYPYPVDKSVKLEQHLQEKQTTFCEPILEDNNSNTYNYWLET